MDDFAEVSKTVEAGATHKSTKDYELKTFSFFAIVDSEYGMWIYKGSGGLNNSSEI